MFHRMSRRHPKTPDAIDPNEIPTRDPLMVEIINGITKAGVQPDQKKEKARKRCRGRVREED